MPSKKKTSETSSSSTPAEPVSGADADEEEEDELELLQVDLGDMVKLKQVLDETVAAAIVEQVPEDYRWDNIKLTIMFTACLFAAAAQFAPLPFPESRPVLGVCGTAYFVLSGILQLITTFIDKDSILLTKPVPDSTNKDMQKYGLRVRSSLPRFSEWYKVIIELQLPKEATKPSPFVEQTWSVGQFFDKEGYFDEVGLMQQTEKLLKRFQAGNYDSPTAAATKKKQ